jgi:hypothetical protein
MQAPIGDHIIVVSAITCPQCSTAKMERMPVDACQIVYKCTGCDFILWPGSGNCYMFLFIRFCSVPADSGRTTSTKLRSTSRRTSAAPNGDSYSTESQRPCDLSMPTRARCKFSCYLSMRYLTGSTRENRFMALCHADAMQIILFCMADFLIGNLWRCLWTFGAPGEIRTPDPQIRSLVLRIEPDMCRLHHALG